MENSFLSIIILIAGLLSIIGGILICVLEALKSNVNPWSKYLCDIIDNKFPNLKFVRDKNEPYESVKEDKIIFDDTDKLKIFTALELMSQNWLLYNQKRNAANISHGFMGILLGLQFVIVYIQENISKVDIGSIHIMVEIVALILFFLFVVALTLSIIINRQIGRLVTSKQDTLIIEREGVWRFEFKTTNNNML